MIELGDKTALQQPTWEEHPAFSESIKELTEQDPLVEPPSILALQSELEAVANGEAFVLQGGPCAERFDDGRDSVKGLLKIMLAMNMVLMYGAGVSVTKVARLGGQYGKPRSSDTEEIGGLVLPSYRGDIVNRPEPNLTARTHDPKNLLRAYDHASQTLHSLDTLTKGGFASIEQMHGWNVEFAANSSQAERYGHVTDMISRAIHFMRASGVDDTHLRNMREASVFTSHEGLILDYEQALTRDYDGTPFATSAHMLWIGERTRQLDGAHIAFFEKVANPLGVKLGPSTTPRDAVALASRLNPGNKPGRLTFITRFGADKIADALPPIVDAIQQNGNSVIWMNDPMHEQTETHESGRKTRRFDRIVKEVIQFIDICDDAGIHPGGLHLEMTGENVTECTGGTGANPVTNLEEMYLTACDPRLNADQSMELAFLVAERLAARKTA